jgi:hypothetical protein
LHEEFPPAFFDIMTQLLLHVVEELDVCGLVHSHWMYLVERMMKVLKGYVCDMSQPEGFGIHQSSQIICDVLKA